MKFYSQEPKHSFETVLNRRHLFPGEAGQGAISEAAFVEGAGLINDYLARLEKPVAWFENTARGVNYGLLYTLPPLMYHHAQ